MCPQSPDTHNVCCEGKGQSGGCRQHVKPSSELPLRCALAGLGYSCMYRDPRSEGATPPQDRRRARVRQAVVRTRSDLGLRGWRSVERKGDRGWGQRIERQGDSSIFFANTTLGAISHNFDHVSMCGSPRGERNLLAEIPSPALKSGRERSRTPERVHFEDQNVGGRHVLQEHNPWSHFSQF